MIFFDLEANGLREQATRIWVISWCEDDGDIRSVYDESGIKHSEEGGVPFSCTDGVVGHNIINYDIPVLNRLGFRFSCKNSGVFDTIIWSRLLWPDLLAPAVPEGVKRPDPHSLAAWAIRFGGEAKVHQETWHEFDPNMVKRCESDVRITRKLYHKIMKEITK